MKKDTYDKIVILTGAGISVASGLPTYRGNEGLWTHDDVGVATREALDRNPDDVWCFFDEMRANAATTAPNAGHLALAEFEASLPPSQSFTLITQNVDGLHERAGSRNVVNFHGTLDLMRCSAPGCSDANAYPNQGPARAHAPRCDSCGAPMRPDIVLFGELIPTFAAQQAKMALRDCDLFVAIGTSGTVSPASNFVRSAAYEGARTVYINPEEMVPANPYFDETILEPAERVLPEFFQSLR